MNAGRVALFAVVAVLVAGAPGALFGQDLPRRGDRIPRPERDSIAGQIERIDLLPDSLLTDSLRFVRDSLVAARDSAALADLEDRREGLSGGDFPDRDDVFRSLLDAPGFDIAEYRGEVVRVGVDGQTLDLEGQAQLNRAGDVLAADTIRYLGGERRFIEARRNIELLGADGRKATSDTLLYYDVDRLRGTLFQAESSFNDGGTEWRVFGNVIPLAQDTIYATHSAFTSCDLEEPHYTFRAGQLKMVSRDVLVAWPVTLYVSRVPVFWLPFFAADIRQGRRSGIIPPRFGFNDIVQTSGSTSRNISDFGYYWAISDYLDAQGTVDWFSGNYTRINGAFRYRFLKQFVRGSLSYSQSFGETGDNLQLRGAHQQEFGLNTKLTAAVNYVQDTRTFQDQSINPDEQTQTIDSDVNLNRRFAFGNLSANARRKQFLDGSRTETTLPNVTLALSPVTLFSAPRNRAGPLNNITLDGSTSFSRRVTRADSASDQVNTRAAASNNLRVGEFSLRSQASLTDLETTLQDSAFVDLPSTSRSTLDWSSSASYRIDLVGSTTLSPTASLSGGRFRSEDTAGDFVTVPGRLRVGAALRSDLYGFYPGFGPFSRLRHKITPGFTYEYSPAVEVDSMLAAIPGFPGSDGLAQNRLSFSLNQTFEARLEEDVAPPDSVIADTLVGGPLPLADSITVGDVTGPPGLASGELPPPTRPERARTIKLLGIRTDVLTFDFERSKLGEPVLVTDRVTNAFTSDLLRGLTVNMTHDLFAGSGTDREFDPFLSSLTTSFSFQSGAGLGDVFGLGGRERTPSLTAPTRSLDRMRDPEIYGSVDPFFEGAGPWSVSLTYSVQRVRPMETGSESRSLRANLALRPTPHWSIRWTTQYSFTDSEFGQNLITLDRDLHRWLASFQFSRAPNGNTVFQVSLSLKDAPDIRTDYSQRTN